MNTFTPNSTEENKANGSSSKKGWQNIGQQLRSFFKNSKPMMDNEIDYYHQYIFPHKANKLLKNNDQQKYTNYVPFAKRKK